MKGRRSKDSVNHGVEIRFVQSRVDCSPSYPPLVPARNSKAIPKEELGHLWHRRKLSEPTAEEEQSVGVGFVRCRTDDFLLLFAMVPARNSNAIPNEVLGQM